MQKILSMKIHFDSRLQNLLNPGMETDTLQKSIKKNTSNDKKKSSVAAKKALDIGSSLNQMSSSNVDDEIFGSTVWWELFFC